MILNDETHNWAPKKFVYSALLKEFRALKEDTLAEQEALCDKPSIIVLAISIFFLVLTFLLYVGVKTLRRPSSIMTMALVLNLIITFSLYIEKFHLEKDPKNLDTPSIQYILYRNSVCHYYFFSLSRVHTVGLHITIFLSGKLYIFQFVVK